VTFGICCTLALPRTQTQATSFSQALR